MGILPTVARSWIARRAIATGLCLFASAVVCAEPVAITFDDLPLNGILAPGTTRVGIVTDVLGILKQHEAPQVYGFINGKKLEGSPDGADALKLWVTGGQRIGNHTYAHPDLSEETTDSFLQNVWENEPVLELLTNGDSWRWFRYPYLREGDSREKRRTVRSQLLQHGYRIAQVTLDYEDYLWNSAYARCAAKHDGKAIASLHASYLRIASEYVEADRTMARAVFGREISHVLLLHLGAFSSEILPDVLTLLREKGFKLVTLEEAQSDSAYDADPDTGSKQGGSLLEQLMDSRGIKYPIVSTKPYKELEAICQ